MHLHTFKIHNQIIVYKNFTKKLFFIALIVFAFSACDTGDVHVENHEWIREITSIAEDPLLVEVLGNFESDLDRGRIESEFGDLNLDEVSKISNDSLIRYSLLFSNSGQNTFANLVLTETEEGTSAHIVQYVPDSDWYDNYGYDKKNWDNYTGKVIYYSPEGVEFARSCMQDGLTQKCSESANGGRAEDVVYECYTETRIWSVCDKNGCVYHVETVSLGCTVHFVPGSGGGSSGGVPPPDYPEDPRDCVFNAVGDCEPVTTPPTPVTPPACGPNDVRNSRGMCLPAWDADVVLLADQDPNSIITDIADYLKCFDPNSPSQITIYVDQPTRGSRDTWSGSRVAPDVGHTFISISQGSNTRIFGFYPGGDGVNPKWEPSTNSILVNDSGHPFDVSMGFTMSSSQTSQLLNSVSNFEQTYNLDSYNCTDFGLTCYGMTGLSLPDSQGEWPFGGGSNPGDLGQDIRSFAGASGHTKRTSSGTGPSNSGNCN